MNKKMRKTLAPAAPASSEPSLADVIREVSRGMQKLTSSGLNRKAIVVLLKDECGVTKSDINKVLNGLDDLEKRYCR